MLTLNTNLSSLVAQTSLKTSTNKLNQAIERMTTGFKVNHASDNAANYSIITNMTTKINAYMVAEDNAAMGLDLISTAEGTLDQIQDKLERLRALQEQASNGTYGEESLQAINKEVNAIVDEIERLYSTAEYNGINLFGKITGTEDSNFLKDIARRDTTGMTALASVDATTFLQSGTYSISTAEELAKLAEMTNNGLIGVNTEFVLGADIDLSCYDNWTPIGTDIHNSSSLTCCFSGIFDGNGYVISNLTIDSPDQTYSGLFSCCRYAVIKNLGVENCNITGKNYVSTIAGYMTRSSIENCYASGSVNYNVDAGGLVGSFTTYSLMKDCYSMVEFSGNIKYSGGLLGSMNNCTEVENCYVLGEPTGLGNIFYGYSSSSITGPGSIKNSGYLKAYDDAGIPYGQYCLGLLISENINVYDSIDDVHLNSLIKNYNNKLEFQVGIDSTSTSKIAFEVGFVVSGLDKLRLMGIHSDCLSIIDDIISSVSAKQTEYGAVQNRLESALDEISTKYDNLVSSRLTLRDADIAQVSATYIQQQILQQASATLLATVNQSPALALQLI